VTAALEIAALKNLVTAAGKGAAKWVVDRLPTDPRQGVAAWCAMAFPAVVVLMPCFAKALTQPMPSHDRSAATPCKAMAIRFPGGGFDQGRA
jgi:hypothetical protein